MSFNLDSDCKQKLPSYFHFQSEGQYSIDISRKNTMIIPINIDIFICVKDEYKKFNEKKHRSCSIYYNVLLDSNETVGKVSGTIKKSGPYQIVIFSSKYSDRSSVLINLRNPKSYLDAYLQPCLYLMPIFLSLFVIFLILWIINTVQYNFHNFSLCQTNFHKILTESYVIILLATIFRICSLRKLHLHNKDGPFNIIKEVFNYLEYTMICYSIFMSAIGLSIVKETIPICEKINIFVNYNIISIFLIVVFNDDSIVIKIFLILSLICGFGFLSTSIKSSKLTLAAHLYIIGEEGIDPTTTPIYKKYQLFEKIATYLNIFYLLATLVIIFCMFSPVHALNYVLRELIVLFFALPLAWFYRYKKEMKKGYMKIDDIDYNSEPKKILSTTVYKISLSNFEIDDQENRLEGEKIIWNDGIPLPPPPIIVRGVAELDGNNEEAKNQNTAEQNDDSNEKNVDDENDDSFVPQINLESMKDLKI